MTDPNLKVGAVVMVNGDEGGDDDGKVGLVVAARPAFFGVMFPGDELFRWCAGEALQVLDGWGFAPLTSSALMRRYDDRQPPMAGQPFVVDGGHQDLGDIPAEQFGARVALRRRELGLSQPELGRRIGRSESWVSQIERGVRHIDRVSVLQALAEALNAKMRLVPFKRPPDVLPEDHFLGGYVLIESEDP
jgi:DNA-binding XRE family transcriptional regulator